MSEEEALRQRVEEFELIIKEAKQATWAREPQEMADHFLEHDSVLAWNVLEAHDAFLTAGVYSTKRLPGFIDRLIDTKLQLYFVSQVVPGTMNAMVYLRGFDPKDPLATPNLELARLSYMQALIGQTRVLWERLIRLVYFLETGSDPPGKSARRRFFGDLPQWSPRWDLLAELEGEIDRYDGNFRTPEYHKGSVLRAELLGGSVVDANEVLGLITPVTNGVWTLLMANVSGEPHNIVRLGHHVRGGSDV